MTQIVEAGPERIEDLEPLWRALAEHHGAVMPELGPLREREDSWRRRRRHYEELLAKAGSFLLIAEREGTAVGYALVSASSPSQTWQLDHAAVLETLVVLPGARGEGIGGRLLERVMERVRASGATHLGLGVVAANAGAIRFYRRHGFEPAFVEMLARI